MGRISYRHEVGTSRFIEFPNPLQVRSADIADSKNFASHPTYGISRDYVLQRSGANVCLGSILLKKSGFGDA
jgi:hypothetical protein